jgi:FdhD protein
MPADEAAPPGVSVAAARQRWRGTDVEAGVRDIPEETPVAIVHDATTTAVMMATPADLEDFARGFTLTEGIVADAAEIAAVEVVEAQGGMEARVWLKSPQSAALASRRRQIAGPTGCGLCGVDSLAAAVRTPPVVGEGLSVTPGQIQAALKALAGGQTLGDLTRAVHAAGWWDKAGGLVAIREDVGRHNALDKLAGALMAQGFDPACGFLVLTSRVSVEMVQKAAAIGAQLLVAVSAPTALAVRTAQEAGMTLAAVAREDGFELFNRPDRIAR